MNKLQSRKQIGSLKINFFLEGGERHVFRAYFPVDGTVPTDVQMDAMARVAGELFRKYADRMDKVLGKVPGLLDDYYRSTIVDRFAELVKSYAGFSAKTAEELAAGWDAADIERMRKEGLDV